MVGPTVGPAVGPAVGLTTGASRAQAPSGDGVFRLLLKLEQLMQAGRSEAYLELLSAVADRGLAAEASQFLILPGITRAVIRERDREALEGTLPGDGFRLMLEVFTERGSRARVTTWRLDIRRVPTNTNEDEWRIAGQQLQTTIDGLYRLALNPVKQYRVRNLVVRSEDLQIKLADGFLFVADAGDMATAAVLMPGTGNDFTFRPAPETERLQVKIYSGAESIEGRYEEVFLRMHPGDFDHFFPSSALTAVPVDSVLFRRAESVFKVEVGKSFGLDLADLSRDTWSLSPPSGDLLAEIRTRRYQTLTYTKSSNDPEDISLYDRRRRRNIATYPSQAVVAARGRFYDEDAQTAYDVRHVQLDVAFDPDREWLDGVARIRLRVKEGAMSNLTLRLAQSLTVRSIYSTEYGRLLSLRVRNQNSLVINLPVAVVQGSEMSLVVTYSGRLSPPPPDREAAGPQFPQQDPTNIQSEALSFPGEPSLLYTTNSTWYPQSTVTDYSTASMRLTVPEPFTVVASGELAPGSPVVVPGHNGRPAGRQYMYEATQPVRYLACVISRFVRASSNTVSLRDALAKAAGPGDGPSQAKPLHPGVFFDTLNVTVLPNPRQLARGREAARQAEDIVQYYASLVGDSPYPSLTVALVERELPGGHSPAYMSVLNQPLPGGSLNWANDPASFPTFPEFFIAHELAHQWWGQAVGWRSYHDRWISEGFAQYFAALYARQSRGELTFHTLIRRMVKWAEDKADEGPISLGYRLGHIRGDSRIFRALAYNKSAVVLHMLRRLLGDDAFFRGLRRFYFESRFDKASTDDVRKAFEKESGLPLEAFFEGWIHGFGVPVLKASWRRDPAAAEATALLKFEQVGKTFVYPVTVTLRYGGNQATDMQVVIRERVTQVRVPLTGSLRDIEVNRDGLSIVKVFRD